MATLELQALMLYFVEEDSKTTSHPWIDIDYHTVLVSQRQRTQEIDRSFISYIPTII